MSDDVGRFIAASSGNDSGNSSGGGGCIGGGCLSMFIWLMVICSIVVNIEVFFDFLDFGFDCGNIREYDGFEQFCIACGLLFNMALTFFGAYRIICVYQQHDASVSKLPWILFTIFAFGFMILSLMLCFASL